LVIIAGSTNGYVAEEVLRSIGQEEGFTREGFNRGLTVGPRSDVKTTYTDIDVIIRHGEWRGGETIYDMVDELKAGDLILKGANAFDTCGKAACQIGHPKAGTIGMGIQTIFGRRVKLIIPVGIEKRVLGDIDDLVRLSIDPDTAGPRLLPLPGEIFTELDAIKYLTGAKAFMFAAGGIYGAEGSVWIGVKGDSEQLEMAENLIKEYVKEPPCEI
jgi:hypothetical protein